MTHTTPPAAPILVNATPALAQWSVAWRQLILVISGVAIAFGFTHLGAQIGALAAIAGPLVGLGSFVYGQLHTRRAEQRQIAMAKALPDEIAKVKP